MGMHKINPANTIRRYQLIVKNEITLMPIFSPPHSVYCIQSSAIRLPIADHRWSFIMADNNPDTIIFGGIARKLVGVFSVTIGNQLTFSG